ncbi:MAG: hypothetical protein HYX48_03585 [Chlamydiales bacterium]|nr:hypothetical protein [Chlamydiales bacterium]
MVRNVGPTSPTPPFYEPPISEEAQLAKKLQSAISNFSDSVKNLTPDSARSVHSLSNLAETIKQLNELSRKASKLE